MKPDISDKEFVAGPMRVGNFYTIDLDLFNKENLVQLKNLNWDGLESDGGNDWSYDNRNHCLVRRKNPG